MMGDEIVQITLKIHLNCCKKAFEFVLSSKEQLNKLLQDIENNEFLVKIGEFAFSKNTLNFIEIEEKHG